LQRGDDPLTLRDGIEVRVKVRVDLYVGSGRFQVVVEDVDPAFTLGKMALTREAILRRLQDEGLADRNRGLPVPCPPLRIGVLGARSTDGFTDFIEELRRSGIGFSLVHRPVKVQGARLKATLLGGLRWFAERAEHVDVLCIL